MGRGNLPLSLTFIGVQIMNEETGLTCLYKDGEAKNFIGEEVQKALSKGWMDTPSGKPTPNDNTADSKVESSASRSVTKKQGQDE